MRSPPAAFVEKLLAEVRRRLPAVDRILAASGERSVGSHLSGLRVGGEPHQGREDLCQAVAGRLAPLLGETVARRAAADLAARPLALTTNHHGVDYFFSSVNGNLLFALGAAQGEAPPAFVPVLAFGNIPLNNANYPRGALLYGLSPDRIGDSPFRIPLFPDRLKRCAVSAAPPWDREMVGRALGRVDKAAGDGTVPAPLAETLASLLRGAYLEKSVLELDTYADQATVVNHRIWGRIDPEGRLPRPICLAFEGLAADLLERDLPDPARLAHRVLFRPGVREPLIVALDGVPGCWRGEELRRRRAGDGTAPERPDRCGTLFFWGIDDRGRKFPMGLDPSSERLLGIDDGGKEIDIRLRPAEILAALDDGRLLPSLFTCFLTIAFARAVACVGGYWQCDYLPAMGRGLAAALEAGGETGAARSVRRVPVDGYLGNMAVVMAEVGGHGLAPAGPVEIIAGGGLTVADTAHMAGVTVREAHMAGLFESVADILPPEKRPEGWKVRLAESCSRLLRGRIMVKG